MSYKTVKKDAFAETEIKKSRFLAHIAEVRSEEEAEALFEDVFQVYAVYSAIGLMERTHKEAPWKNTPTGTGSVIDQKLMKSFFKKRLRHE